jgi:hypothetical protein
MACYGDSFLTSKVTFITLIRRITGMSNFKQVVIYFLVSKLPVFYHPFLSS